jgi:hypothetical protein
VKKIVTLILVTVCVASLFLTIPSKVYSQTGTAEGMKVVSYSWYISAFSGYFVVVGEVQNVGSGIFSSSVLTGSVVTSDQQAQAFSDYTIIYSAGLLPGETAPFYMMFTPESSTWGNLTWVSLGIDRVDFNFYNTPTQTAPYSGLFIGANTSYIDMSGNYTVEGVVINRGNLYPQNVWVVASFYDASGKVVAVGYSNYLSPHYLPPTNSTLFRLTPTDPTAQMASEIVNYKLTVLSENEVATPPASSAPTSVPVETSSPSSENPTATPIGSVTAQPDNGVSISMTTVYVIVAAVAVVVAILALMLMLRKKSKR